MSDFRITGPGFYRTRSGEKAEVLGRITMIKDMDDPWIGCLNGSIGVRWADDGRWDRNPHHRDLIAPWTEPKKGTVWVNVYADGHMSCSDRGQADRIAMRDRIACVSVNWTEGEGL